MRPLFKKLYIYLKSSNPNASIRSFLSIYVEVLGTCQSTKEAIEDWLDTGKLPNNEVRIKDNLLTITVESLVKDMKMSPLRALLTIDTIARRPDASADILNAWLHRPVVSESIEEYRKKVDPEILKMADELMAKEEEEYRSLNSEIMEAIDKLSKQE